MTTKMHAESPLFETRRMKVLPWLWLALSALWAVVLFATDVPAWTLAIWIATTIGPITLVRSRLDTAAA